MQLFSYSAVELFRGRLTGSEAHRLTVGTRDGRAAVRLWACAPV